MANVASLLDVYEITLEDLVLISQLGERVIPILDDYVEAFYTWLEPQPEFSHFFQSHS